MEDRRRTKDIQVAENIDFSGLLLSPHILRGLNEAGYSKPSPIQLKAIPLGRFGVGNVDVAKLSISSNLSSFRYDRSSEIGNWQDLRVQCNSSRNDICFCFRCASNHRGSYKRDRTANQGTY